MDGILVEERDACVAGAVCDQTDDQHQEQVPGPLRLCIGSLTRYPGFCVPNKSIVEFAEMFHFRFRLKYTKQESRAG